MKISLEEAANKRDLGYVKWLIWSQRVINEVKGLSEQLDKPVPSTTKKTKADKDTD